MIDSIQEEKSSSNKKMPRLFYIHQGIQSKPKVVNLNKFLFTIKIQEDQLFQVWIHIQFS